MGELSDNLLPGVAELTQALGKSITFQTVVKTGNPATGAVSESSAADHVVVAPIFNVEERYLKGDLIRDSDMQTIVAAQGLTFTPVRGMRVTVGSEIWETIRIDPIYADTEVVAYLIFLRR
jgi:hypothetical protein